MRPCSVSVIGEGPVGLAKAIELVFEIRRWDDPIMVSGYDYIVSEPMMPEQTGFKRNVEGALLAFYETPTREILPTALTVGDGVFVPLIEAMLKQMRPTPHSHQGDGHLVTGWQVTAGSASIWRTDAVFAVRPCLVYYGK